MYALNNIIINSFFKILKSENKDIQAATITWLVQFAHVPSQYYTVLRSWQNGNCFVYYYLVVQGYCTSLQNSMIFVGFACFAHFDRKCYFDWNCCFGRNCRWFA